MDEISHHSIRQNWSDGRKRCLEVEAIPVLIPASENNIHNPQAPDLSVLQTS
jgi:hypothetical protein